MQKRVLAMLLSVSVLISLFHSVGFAVNGEVDQTGDAKDSTEAAAEVYKVVFDITPADAQIIVSAGIGYTYTEPGIEPVADDKTQQEDQATGDGTGTDSGTGLAPGTENGSGAAEQTNTQQPEEGAILPEETEPKPAVYELEVGDYTATITKEGYYASVFSFSVMEDGRILAVNNEGNVNSYVSGGVFTFAMTEFLPSETEGAWDGVTLDVSWYDETAETMTICTPAQFAGMAAIVNGIYNAETTAILDDADGDGVAESYTSQEYAQLENRKIRPQCSDGGTGSNNLVTTDSYWYGAKSDDKTPADFNGQTVLVAADLDMGGWQQEDGAWTGARYMPIGGQYLMHYIVYSDWMSDGYSHLGSSFNGKLDGQGHYIKNVYCDRYGTGSNYGDSASIGLIGRLGNHDNDPVELAAVNPTVRNIAVAGYIYGRRSVGGIVGKIGKTSAEILRDSSTGGIIENCMNFAEVKNTDAKGCGGIVGAGWNAGVVRYCANFGAVSSTYRCPTGGISGSNEVFLENCYNVGPISSPFASFTMAIGTNNGGASVIDRCFWLTGTASGGGYYNGKGATEITDNYNNSGLSAEEYMQSDIFLAELNGTGRTWVFKDDGGYPVPRAFTIDTTVVTGIEKTSDPQTLEYVEGQKFDPTGLEIYALYSDQTKELIQDYHIIPDRPLQMGDTTVLISGTYGNQTYRYEYTISVVEAELTAISIIQEPDSILYANDETFSPAGMVVKAYYTNAPSKGMVLSEDQYTWNLEGALLTVSYTYHGVTMTDTCQITWLDSPRPQCDSEGAYLLYTEDDLRWFANQVNALGQCTAKAVVQQDITVDEANFAGIGCSGSAYIGDFDGEDHTITLQMERSKSAGLFAVVGEATIRNVTVAGSVSSTSTSGTGGLVGYVTRINEAGSQKTLTIENCVNLAAITATAYTGGIVGKSVLGSVTISNCSNEGAVQADTGYSGGIVGYSGGGLQVTACTNQAAMQSSTCCGGIVGYVRTSSSEGAVNITDCINLGAINGSSDNIGGIAGYLGGISESCNITVNRCCNRAVITGKNAVGGLVGYAYYTHDMIENSYNEAPVTATGIVINRGAGGIVGCNVARICNVYNLGTVASTSKNATEQVGVGGIVGTAMSSGSGIENVYNAGSVGASGRASCGSIVGYVYFSINLENTHCLQAQACGAVASGSTVTGQPGVHTEKELMTMAKTLGEAFRESDICGYWYPVLNWQVGPPHTWDDGRITLEPTCTEPGEETFTCTQCGMLHIEQVEVVECASAGFADIPGKVWYHDAVDYMIANGYMNGYNSTTFAPNDTVTRAQLVMILYRLAGEPAVNTANNPFTDVPNYIWYAKAVIWGAQAGVVNGVGNGRFLPDGEVTREQIAAMIYRYVQAKPVQEDHLSGFPDHNAVSGFAVQPVNWAVASGLISGAAMNDGTVLIMPASPATRAQIAQILTNWLKVKS